LGSHLLLAGYFGCGNLGDDAILMGLTNALQSDDVELTLLSGSPEATFRNYGIPSVGRKDLRRVEEAIARCDVLVFPGGSVFQDSTSVRSPAYYGQLVQRAKKQRKRVVFLAQGVGPLKSFLGKRIAAGAFNAADAIVVRDPGSASSLRELGVRVSPRIGADLAFLMPRSRGEPAEDFRVGGMKAVGIAPRPLGTKTKAIEKLFAGLARKLFSANFIPVLIAMDRIEDAPVIHAINKIQGGKIPNVLGLEIPLHIQQRMSRMDSVIAMRLHAGILAANVDVPPFMVSYDPKVTAFAKVLELHSAPPVEGLTPERLFELFIAFQRDHERNQRLVARKREELVRLAEVNIEVLRSCIAGPIKV
jgi:polysaccharide pyruvyl transferase CsaB